MATVSSLENLNTTENTEKKVLAILAETYPNLDCGPGTPMYEMVVRPIAYLWARQNVGLEELIKSVSFSDYINMAEEDMDRLMNRYFITRRHGDYVNGVVRIIVTADADIYIRAGEIWEASDGRTYEVDSEHLYSIADIIEEDSDNNKIHLLPGTDDKYFFDIGVTSTGVGEAFNAYENDSIKPTGDSSANILRAYFLTSTNDGGRTESNSELITRAKDELAYRGMGSYKSVTALLRENFPLLKKVVPIGLRDPELIRDIESIRLEDGSLHTIHTGRKADIYVQPLNYTIEEGYTAPLGFPLTYNNIELAKNPDALIAAWNPNFVESTKIDPDTGSEVEVAPAISIQNTGLRGSLNESLLGLDKNSPITNLKADILDVHNFVADSDNTSLHVDNLVKQMWPLVVTVDVSIEDQNPDRAAANVKVALTEYINSLPLEQAPQVANIAYILKSIGIEKVHVPIKLKAYYLTEAGLIEWISAVNDVNEHTQSTGSILETLEADSLKFKVRGTHQISLRTCCWYTSEDLITVHVN